MTVYYCTLGVLLFHILCIGLNLVMSRVLEESKPEDLSKVDWIIMGCPLLSQIILGGCLVEDVLPLFGKFLVKERRFIWSKR